MAGSIYDQVQKPSFYVGAEKNESIGKYVIHEWACEIVPEPERCYFPADAQMDGPEGIQAQALQALGLRWGVSRMFRSGDLRICGECNPWG